MPKRILMLAFAVTALALAACNSGLNDINDLYGTPEPSSTAAAASPNPTASSAVVIVYAASTPLPNQPVSLYNAVVTGPSASPQAQVTGTPIATQTTDSTGTTTFNNLTAKKWYCFLSSYTPSGGLMQNLSACTDLWGNANVDLYFST